MGYHNDLARLNSHPARHLLNNLHPFPHKTEMQKPMPENNNNNHNGALIRPEPSNGQPRLVPYDFYDPYSYPVEYVVPAAHAKHIRDYWRVVMRRKWIALACVVAAVACAAIYTMRQTPLYRATAQLEVDQQSDNVLPYQQVMAQNDYSYMYEEYLQTQIKHLTSRNLASRVAIVAGLDKEDAANSQTTGEKSGLFSRWAWLRGPDKSAEQARPLTKEERLQQGIDQVLGGLSVTPAKNSRVAEISFTSPDPKLAARIVNILCQEYIDYNFQAKYDATSRATDFLQKQLVDLKAKVEKSDNDLIEYARTHSIMNVSEKEDVVTQTLGEINSKLTEARAARMEKESVYRTLAQATPENFPQALRTPLITTIETNLMNDEQDLAKLTSQFGPGMPQVKQLESRVRRAREQLQHERQLAIDNAHTEFETATAREKLLAQAFDKQKGLADQLNESNIHYNILKREVETNKQLYDGLLQRMKEAGVAASLKSSNIRIVDKAEVPGAPYSPDLHKNLSLGLLLGLTGGLGLAFFLNYLDNTVKTPEDVEEMIGLPSLGLIPSLKSSHGSHGYRYSKERRKHKAGAEALLKQGVEMASLTAGSSLIAEAYRGVRTALLLSTPENPPKIIMVTSSKASEGKTTTVCNTALSLAQTGRSVLILDCDMRRPKIRKIFSGIGNAGLSEYLTGQVDFSDVIQVSHIPNLFIVHSGTIPPNPGELLGSQRMIDAIEALSSTFDFVLIDTPPLMSVTDPLIIAPMTDGVILVTKGGGSPPEVLKKAKKSLELVHARILGVLCNSVDLHSTAYHYYYHQYQDYHSYVSTENTTPPASPC
jgi:succinoglycan biosynthesis transport protein ExoP